MAVYRLSGHKIYVLFSPQSASGPSPSAYIPNYPLDLGPPMT